MTATMILLGTALLIGLVGLVYAMLLKPEKDAKKQTQKLIEQVKKEPLEFNYSAEELRNLNRKV